MLALPKAEVIGMALYPACVFVVIFRPKYGARTATQGVLGISRRSERAQRSPDGHREMFIRRTEPAKGVLYDEDYGEGGDDGR